MTLQQQAFQSYYHSLTDEELTRIAANKRSFLEVAQEALANELHGRHLDAALPPETHRAVAPSPGPVVRMARKAAGAVAIAAAEPCPTGLRCPRAPERRRRSAPARSPRGAARVR